MRKILPSLLALAGAALPAGAALADAANPVCPEERVFFDPGNGEARLLRRASQELARDQPRECRATRS